MHSACLCAACLSPANRCRSNEYFIKHRGTQFCPASRCTPNVASQVSVSTPLHEPAPVCRLHAANPLRHAKHKSHMRQCCTLGKNNNLRNIFGICFAYLTQTLYRPKGHLHYDGISRAPRLLRRITIAPFAQVRSTAHTACINSLAAVWPVVAPFAGSSSLSRRENALSTDILVGIATVAHPTRVSLFARIDDAIAPDARAPVTITLSAQVVDSARERRVIAPHASS
jgi:hypothetical protein